MDSQRYLKSFGWKEGEALQKGGIKKPILVKHKNDKKGIGHQPNGGVDAWWERLFDGQLKAFDVKEDEKGLSFRQEKFVASGLAVSDSPLYRMFIRGETLGGTQGKVEILEIKRSSDGLASTDFTQIKTSFNKNGSKGVIPHELNQDGTRISENSKDVMEMDHKKKRKKYKKNLEAKSETKERSKKKAKKVKSSNKEKLEVKEKDKKGRCEKKAKRERSENKIKDGPSDKKRKRFEKPEKVKGEKAEIEKSVENSSKKRNVADEESSEAISKKFKKSKK